MQRNRSNLRPISALFTALLLVLYEVATTQLRFLPPLIGVLFTYLVLEAARHQKAYDKFGVGWYFAIVMIVFAEQIHGFYLFSSLIAFLLFFNFIVDWLASAMKWRTWLLAIYVASGYVWTFGVHNLIAYMQNAPLLKFGREYPLFIVVETVLAIILFRGRAL